jgi:hypothetical protein
MKRKKSLDESAAELSGAAFGQEAQLGKPGFSLENDENSALGFVIASGIDFPVTGDAPGIDGGRSERNGDAQRDVATRVFAGNEAAMHAFAMRFGEQRNEEASVAVDPLVNGFMADGATGQIERNAACDQFR